MHSERRACLLVGISRSVFRYQVQPGNDEDLRGRLKQLAGQYPRYGYKLLHRIVKREELVVNAKRTYRIYREERLQVRTKRRKKLPRQERTEMILPSQPYERWSLDFVSDQLADGRRFRVLNIVDDYSRECPGQIVDFSISGDRLARFLQTLDRLPREIVMDNGPELTSKAMFLWAEAAKVKLRFIDPGKPIQNAFVESFNGRFRDTCLNEHWFVSLADARKTIEDWRRHYNEERPHSSLGYKTPAQARMCWQEGCGKAGRFASLENSPSFPLSHNPYDDYDSFTL